MFFHLLLGSGRRISFLYTRQREEKSINRKFNKFVGWMEFIKRLYHNVIVILKKQEQRKFSLDPTFAEMCLITSYSTLAPRHHRFLLYFLIKSQGPTQGSGNHRNGGFTVTGFNASFHRKQVAGAASRGIVARELRRRYGSTGVTIFR